MNPQVISTWLFREAADNRSLYPNLGRNTDSDMYARTYFRCAVCFFATSRVTNPRARHILFSNTEALPSLDGRPATEFLSELGVELHVVQYRLRPREDRLGRFANQFYIYDLISALSQLAATDAHIGLFDSDCVWLAPFSRMAPEISRDGLLTTTIDYPPDYEVNGLSLAQVRDIYDDLGIGPEVVPRYSCGEFVVGTGAAFERLSRMLDAKFPLIDQRAKAGLRTFREEAHFLSYIYLLLDIDAGNGNAHMRRIWTPFRGHYDFHEMADDALALWHLPAEKRFGFVRLFRLLANSEFARNWQMEDLLPAYRRCFLIPRQSGLRRYINATRFLGWRLADGLLGLRRGIM